MDSQLTLVNLPPPLCLTFSTNSMINVILYRDSQPAYIISTDLRIGGSTTEIRAADGTEVLARVTRKELLPDTIAFPHINGGEEMRLSKWLRRCKLSDNSDAHVIETEVGNCVLKKWHNAYRLALFAEYDLETPVAHWERANSISPLSLMFYSGTENFHPQIIAAFTIMELKMRREENAQAMRFSRFAARSTTLMSIGHGNM
ncbi:Peptide methionine sulfoxide reductase [Mycena sanguinolenta]|uniref:Peptide methionine sulfoxide reductase n=1 Tax=Mycena sanguinolenta TaxID=230812 RepID=A0A8H6XJ99_9AGAR|nr:Peptide methionine sulfoxide reductase [Mycena sanguinolenta]